MILRPLLLAIIFSTCAESAFQSKFKNYYVASWTYDYSDGPDLLGDIDGAMATINIKCLSQLCIGNGLGQSLVVGGSDDDISTVTKCFNSQFALTRLTASELVMEVKTLNVDPSAQCAEYLQEAGASYFTCYNPYFCSCSPKQTEALCTMTVNPKEATTSSPTSGSDNDSGSTTTGAGDSAKGNSANSVSFTEISWLILSVILTGLV